MGCQGSKASSGQSPTLLASPSGPKSVEQSSGSLPKGTLDGAIEQHAASLPGEPAGSTTSKDTSLMSGGGHHSEPQSSSPLPVPSGSIISNRTNSTAPQSSVSIGTASTRKGMLQKQRTLCTEKNELDVMVVEFISHDSTVGNILGRNCKEMQWKVLFDRQASPIDIKLHVQERKLHHNEVSIESNGQPIFHGAGSQATSKMKEDFSYKWPFRANIRGINEPYYFEMHPSHSNSDTWFPATITAQRPDGHFEVIALEPDVSGRTVERRYPAVDKSNLREAASRKPLAVPENHLLLEVPKDNPLHAALSLADGENVTHHFGRPSPPTSSHTSELALKVSKDRSTVAADVGHGVLSHFVSGEVQAVTHDTERLRHSWTVMLGPFAQHTIEITKKYTLGKIVTLLVDGEILVEASPADIGSEGHDWQCDFRFVGERVLDFEVYKTNVDGAALDEIDHVKERRKYVHECSVVIPNNLDFTSAQLVIDESPFSDLPMKPHQHEDVKLCIDPTAMMHSYGITVPYKVDQKAPSNMMALATSVFAKADGSKKAAGGFFARCCDCSTVVKDDDEQR